MTLRFSILFFVGASIYGCVSKEQDTSTTNSALENESVPTDYCIVTTNFGSFEHPPDRHFTWIIDGYKITVDSLKEFKVKTYGGLDTVIFHNTSRNKTEVILCDLTKSERYEIFYNSCCSDFFLWKEHNRGSERSVEFKMNETPKGMKLIGGVSFEAAFLKAGEAITLTGDYMRSPMFPNRYEVFVQEYEPWPEDRTIARIINPITRKELSAFKNQDTKLIDFQYIFLDNEKLQVLVDDKTGVSVARIE